MRGTHARPDTGSPHARAAVATASPHTVRHSRCILPFAPLHPAPLFFICGRCATLTVPTRDAIRLFKPTDSEIRLRATIDPHV